MNIIKNHPINILNTDYKSWLFNYKSDAKWKPPIDTEFLERTLPYLAAIPLIRNEDNKVDSTKTLKLLLENKCTLKSPHEKVPPSKIIDLMQVIYTFPRSSLLTNSQVKQPKYASLTPIAMYAQKLYNNVGYSEWDKKDNWVKYFLGKNLEGILDTPDLQLDEKDLYEHRERAVVYKSGARMGAKALYTEYKCNIQGFSLVDEDNTQEGVYNFTDYPKISLYIKLQLWLANAAYRVPGVMILDPVNWWEVPKPLDNVSTPFVEKEKVEDAPWIL